MWSDKEMIFARRFTCVSVRYRSQYVHLCSSCKCTILYPPHWVQHAYSLAPTGKVDCGVADTVRNNPPPSFGVFDLHGSIGFFNTEGKVSVWKVHGAGEILCH